VRVRRHIRDDPARSHGGDLTSCGFVGNSATIPHEVTNHDSSTVDLNSTIRSADSAQAARATSRAGSPVCSLRTRRSSSEVTSAGRRHERAGRSIAMARRRA
jgi:hypothetical protein